MGLVVRKATAADAPAWLDLLRVATQGQYADRGVYDPGWVAMQLQESEAETWIAEENGVIHSTLSFLAPSFESNNPVANIGRHLCRPESYENGAAGALMSKALELAGERRQLLISRVLASDTQQQRLYEQAGFCAAGFQPFKHSHQVRENALFYFRLGGHDISARLRISESLSQVAELARHVLTGLSLDFPPVVRDGITGYPLRAEVEFSNASAEDFDLWRLQAASAGASVEISGAYNQGIGFLRASSNTAVTGMLAHREGKVTAGILFLRDPVDRCVRLTESFSVDDLSLGPLLAEFCRRFQNDDAPVYIEMDVLATAQRLLKSAEQLGFVPVAYLPAVYWKSGSYTDVVKLVKLNIHYALENVCLTPEAQRMAQLIDQNFQDLKTGIAFVNLLRELPFFEGLGDGELRKIARLFTQKLYRPGEVIFKKGEFGNEAYVVMRGQVNVMLAEGAPPIAQFDTGQIFGELAFLEGAPRTAMAVASQVSILLMVQRVAFNTLAQREPHLGMVVMRNIALELSKRLRKSNQTLAAVR